MPQSTWRRPALACALGLLAFVLAGDPVPKLETAPRFLPGGAFVLASFIGLGTGPGLLTGLFFVIPLLSATPTLGTPALLLALLRLAEAWGASLLYRRVGSIVLAVALYWLTAGLLLDLGSLGAVLSLPADALLLLFVHQFMGGLVNGLVAEALLRVPILSSLLPARDDLRAMSLEQYVFSRVVFVATIPALVLALLFTHTAYDGALARSERRTVARLRDAEARLRADLAKRSEALQRLARQLELDWNAASANHFALLALQPAPAGFDQLVLLSSEGRVLARSPGGSPLAETALGADLGSHPWFQVVRDRIGPAVSPLFRAAGSLEPVVILAEPLLRADGKLRGALAATLAPHTLRPGLPEAATLPQEHVTVLDPHLLVLATRRPDLRTGDSLRGILTPALTEAAAATPFAFEPGGARGLSAALGLESAGAAYARLPPWGFGILVDRPARETRRELVPVAGRLLAFFACMLALLYAVVARFGGRVSGPLLALDDASGAIAEGRFPKEAALRRLFRSPIAEIRSVAFRFLAMRDALAYKDALTGLPNRALFLDRLTQSLAQARRDRHRLAVLRLGLDRFRLVLDTLGHAAGDALLQVVAARLREPVREADSVARLAADEFGVLVRQVHEVGDAARVARKLLEAVSAPVTLGGREIVITASVGVAMFPGDGDRDETLLQNADAAMHRAKGAGGDAYRLYAPTMNDHALEQLALESELRRAVALREFEVHYQPIVDQGGHAFWGSRPWCAGVIPSAAWWGPASSSPSPRCRASSCPSAASCCARPPPRRSPGATRAWPSRAWR